MKTLKTAVVVVLLLAVLYGLYMVLNKPESPASSDASWPQPGPLQIETGVPATPGELSPLAGRELERNDSAPPDMPSALPKSLDDFEPATRDFEPGSASLAQANAAKNPAAKKPAAVAASVYDARPAEGTSGASEVRPAGASRSVAPKAFADAWKTALRQMEEGRHKQALASLTVFYDSPDLSPEQQRQLLDVLDPLAGKVIYSTEHLVEMPYDVRKGENLYDIARHYHVTWLLLGNINGIDNPEVLLPGQRLKVLRGPFRAEVKLLSTGQGELTLFLEDLYAGRFPVTIGRDRPLRPGMYEVQEKQEWPTYTGTNGKSWPSKHPQNPYGRWWLSLGSEASIHSSPTSGGNPQGQGSISLSPIDAADIYSILTLGSKVEVRE